jgi:hypothetical protein
VFRIRFRCYRFHLRNKLIWIGLIFNGLAVFYEVIFVGVQRTILTWFRNLAFVIALFSAVSFGQITDKLNVSVGGGVSSPTNEAGQDLHTG